MTTPAGAFEVIGGGLTGTEEHPDEVDSDPVVKGVTRLDDPAEGGRGAVDEEALGAGGAGVTASAAGAAKAGKDVDCSWSRTSPGTLRFSTSFSACRLQMVASIILILSFSSSTSLRTAFIKCDFTRSYKSQTYKVIQTP